VILNCNITNGWDISLRASCCVRLSDMNSSTLKQRPGRSIGKQDTNTIALLSRSQPWSRLSHTVTLFPHRYGHPVAIHLCRRTFEIILEEPNLVLTSFVPSHKTGPASAEFPSLCADACCWSSPLTSKANPRLFCPCLSCHIAYQ
jgi:hypothetical protein